MPEAIIDITTRLARPALHATEPPCSCATNLQQVESAWRLVYERYSQTGLIDGNPFGIHAVPAAVGQHACVIWGPDGPEVGYTMTLFGDSPIGLPLDSVYAEYLDELRRDGRRLLEVGMLADRRQCAAHCLKALFSMMRWGIHYGLHNDMTDIVIGVHPRHAQFYQRCYGFETFAPPTNYPMVRNHPVVLLRLRLLEQLAKDVLPRGLTDACANPLPRSAFAQRFAFGSKQLRGSLIAAFMKSRHGIDLCQTAKPERARPILANHDLDWSTTALAV
ncbi:MAG TPA: hypothetical protein VF284_02585 [Rhodanobacteraceae bacterium]